MRIDAIVPAYNEEQTVASVVSALVASRCFRTVFVVDDGSKDRTAAEATRAGATVLRTPVNGGKGEAMRLGVNSTDADFIAFFDADLIGLKPKHAAALIEPIVKGALMSCGLRDYGPVYNALQTSLPIITGERVVHRSILDSIPPEFWRGWRLEAAMNDAAARLQAPVATRVLSGVTMRPKWAKVGIRKGLEDGAKMMVEVLCAIRDARTRP